MKVFIYIREKEHGEWNPSKVRQIVIVCCILYNWALRTSTHLNCVMQMNANYLHLMQFAFNSFS